MRRRHFLTVAGTGLTAPLLVRSLGAAEPRPAARAAHREPIIDVHLHAYPADGAIDAALANPATGRPSGVANGEAHLQACLAEMKRLNIVRGVVSGGDGDRLAAAAHWHDAAPDRFIAAAGIRGSEQIPLPPLDVLRTAFTKGPLRVMGEVTAQYAGLTLSDPLYEPYLALAEELDVPVAVHMGIGPPGMSQDDCCRGLRAGLGKPLVLEDALNRHPKLRLNVMHGGWPYLPDTVALLTMYPQVATDLGAIDWILPRPEFHAYLGGLMRAGLGKRVLFGSDQMYWPEAIGIAVDAVESAPFLSRAEKRDIFYGNAVRFLKLDA
jgi:predicted TIM-barrel fold metal-dependent hydrolase